MGLTGEGFLSQKKCTCRNGRKKEEHGHQPKITHAGLLEAVITQGVKAKKKTSHAMTIYNDNNSAQRNGFGGGTE